MKQLLLLLLLTIQVLPDTINSLYEYGEKLREYKRVSDSLENIRKKSFTSSLQDFSTRKTVNNRRYHTTQKERTQTGLAYLGLFAVLFSAIYLVIKNRLPDRTTQKIVEKSIKLLFEKIPAEELQQYSIYDPDFSSSWTDPIIETQHIAKSIALHYKLHVNTISVSFDSSLPVGGRVELHNGYDFFIEINRKYIDNPIKIIAILAHEIAHIFLSRRGILFPETLHNEILTDSCAALLGFGYCLIKNYTTEVIQIANYTKTEKLGYINSKELAFITALSNYFNKREVSALEIFQKSGAPLGDCKKEVKSGHKHFYKRLKQIPFCNTTHMRYRSYKKTVNKIETMISPTIIKKRTYLLKKENDTRIEFACPVCSKSVRIPVLGKKLQVSCPQCQIKLTCFT